MNNYTERPVSQGFEATMFSHLEQAGIAGQNFTENNTKIV
jgi:hypothetical protein